MTYLSQMLNLWFQDSDKILPVKINGMTRGNFPNMFASEGYKYGAEIGVDKGKYSEFLLKKTPGLQMLCVDPWSSFGEKSERSYTEAVERLSKYSAKIVRKTSVEASLQVPDNSLDFVYIDGNHTFDYVMTDIILWTRKVRPGGMVSGHDYFLLPRINVMDAVNIYTRVHKINQWFITDESKPSWFWVKK